MPEFDVEALRARFPALAIEQDGRPVALFDGPGGTQVPDTVIEAVSRYYRESNANHDGPFLTSQRSDAVVDDAHAALADLLNAADPSEIKFGANMTTLTMHVARSITASFQPGDEIVVTSLDHEANVGPWRSAAADRGLMVRTVDIRPDDVTLDIEAFDAILHERPKLVAFGWASNAVGSINPVAELVRRAHEAGALTYVDAVHAAPHLPIDVQAVGTDFLACSVYKFFGPHVGVLYGRSRRARRAADLQAAAGVRPVRDRHPQLRGDRRVARGGRVHRRDRPAVRRAVRAAVPGHDRAAPRGARRHGGDPRLRDAAVRPAARRARRRSRASRVWGITDRARFEERTPTAAVTFAGVHAGGRVGRARATGGSRPGGATSTPSGRSSAWASSPRASSGSGSPTTTRPPRSTGCVDELREIAAGASAA